MPPVRPWEVGSWWNKKNRLHHSLGGLGKDLSDQSLRYPVGCVLGSAEREILPSGFPEPMQFFKRNVSSRWFSRICAPRGRIFPTRMNTFWSLRPAYACMRLSLFYDLTYCLRSPDLGARGCLSHVLVFVPKTVVYVC